MQPPNGPEEHLPVTERMESVCRSLFGPVDHEQLREELTLKLKEIYEQDSLRWNFNFQTETPLPGRLQWERVAADREPSASESGDDVSNTRRRTRRITDYLAKRRRTTEARSIVTHVLLSSSCKTMR